MPQHYLYQQRIVLYLQMSIIEFVSLRYYHHPHYTLLLLVITTSEGLSCKEKGWEEKMEKEASRAVERKRFVG